MNKTSIDWPNLDYTWNPATGCLRNCSYCYARKIYNRFNKTSFEKIKYHYDRLNDPYKIKKSSTIFIGSMSDICYWDEFFMDKVIEICKNNIHNTFMFLTKSPDVYKRYIFPSNCSLGITVDCTNDYDINKILFLSINGINLSNSLFLSVEPLLGAVKFGNIVEHIDLIIVGAMTGKNAVIPKSEWIESLRLLPQEKVYYKNNIKKYLT